MTEQAARDIQEKLKALKESFFEMVITGHGRKISILEFVDNYYYPILLQIHDSKFFSKKERDTIRAFEIQISNQKDITEESFRLHGEWSDDAQRNTLILKDWVSRQLNSLNELFQIYPVEQRQHLVEDSVKSIITRKEESSTEDLVFIGYVHEDIRVALDLYKHLKIAGFEPWLDKGKERIYSEDWKMEIRQNIKNCRYFIALWSTNSIGDDGLIARELKESLDFLSGIRSNNTSVIHARLDNIHLPDNMVDNRISLDMFPDWDKGVRDMLSVLGRPNIVVKNEAKPAGGMLFKNLNEVYWDYLIKFVNDKQCIPFIGSGAHSFLRENGEPWIPANWEIADDMIKNNLNEDRGEEFDFANEWIEEIKQKRSRLFDDSYVLARVSQLLAIRNGDPNFPKLSISNYLEQKSAPNFASEQYGDTVYAILADLDLPIYVTSNYDLYMEKALISRSEGHKNPVSGYSWWNDDLALAKSNPLEFDKRYRPSAERPFVYHLHGHIGKRESIVLTEKDFFDFVSYFNKERQTHIYPDFLSRQLSLSSLLFIGYSIYDLSFRTIFQGALSFLGGKPKTTSISVQLPRRENQDKISFSEKVIEYFNHYNRDMFDIQVYWGDISDFVRELRGRIR